MPLGAGSDLLSMATALSLALHGAFAIGILLAPSYQEPVRQQSITMQILEPEKEVRKLEPKIEPKPKKVQPKVVSERKLLEKPKEVVKPIQGLSSDALSPHGKGVAAPVGNTLMVEDDGKLHKVEDVKSLSNDDLSADARMIDGSISPPSYTEDAIDANLEGSIGVDVFVDAKGKVTKAELQKKVGHGMDDRIIEAVMKARFEPRKDQFGRAISGWSEIKFRLEIP